MATRYIIIICLQILFVVSENTEEYILCANSGKNIAHLNEDGIPEENSPESIPTYSKKCKNNYCYTLWKEDPNGTISIMGQGCWEASGKPNECDQSECLADHKPPKAMNDTKFCCCSQNMCNNNFSDIYVPQKETVTESKKDVIEHKTLIIIICVVFVSIVSISLILAAVIVYRRGQKKDDIENQQEAIPPPGDLCLEKLKLLDVIGQGRYGCVWKGIIEDQEVAVKVFHSHHRNNFLNEHEIYKVAEDHSSLLKCYGGGEFQINNTGPPDYILLLSLEQECLQEYLKKNTLNLQILSKMSLGIAKGLAHLHGDIGKPCITHRDLNTRNVLVRSDLTCVVSDLGLAVIPRRTENKSLSEAGTLRYMAPEVLEGAVNLRDCESALKQIDVYALGLVLWELGTRCTDMQNAEPPGYMAPFAKETGENATLEQMQTLVSRRKARPLWPASWKDTTAARLLCETSEDCWDQDAEARLTAVCVVERLLELPTLKGRVLHPMHSAHSPTQLINNNHLHEHQIEASVGTIETLLSPSEEHCKNSNQLATCIIPLQPYQGRNPCMERNLLTGSTDSLLIDKSSKHCNNSDSQNLITNDYLNFQVNHRATPIPYLQNAVHGAPKQQNTMSNTKIHKKSKWNGFRKLFNSKKHFNKPKNLCKDTQVKLNGKLVNGVTTSLLANKETTIRPSSLPLTIAKNPIQETTNSGVQQILKRNSSLSLEQFSEVFSSTTDLSRLKDPSQRVKTPGDVPPSVRRTRGKAAANSARFSLYDDRIMCREKWGSAPDLEPTMPLKPPQINDIQDRDSVSSF